METPTFTTDQQIARHLVTLTNEAARLNDELEEAEKHLLTLAAIAGLIEHDDDD